MLCSKLGKDAQVQDLLSKDLLGSESLQQQICRVLKGWMQTQLLAPTASFKGFGQGEIGHAHQTVETAGPLPACSVVSSCAATS